MGIPHTHGSAVSLLYLLTAAVFTTGEPALRLERWITKLGNVTGMTTAQERDGVRPCSVARTLDVVGEKWSLLAVREMMLGTHRFGEIVKHTGAPRDILTTRLRKLEDKGLVERRLYSSKPARFEYHLTELGQTLSPVITVLRQWGDEHLVGPDGRPMTFTHACGVELDAELVCVHCGKPVAGSSVRRQ